MPLRNFLTRLIKKNPSASYKNFDQKLINGLKTRPVPTWQQLKYVGKFLNSKEKRIITTTASILLVILLAWIIIFFQTHIVLSPKAGGEYIEAVVGQPKYLNPIFSTSNEVDSDITPLFYSGLFRFSNDKKILPNLASGYTISADKKIYTVTLRQDVKWSDGQPFTATDVIFTFEAIQNPEVSSPLITGFTGIEIKKINDYTITFALKEPYAPFLSSLTVGILPEHVWGEIPPASMHLAKNNLQPVGTGPWQFSKMIKDDIGNVQSYTLTRNEKYYRQLPYLKTLTFKFFSDYNQAMEALRGQVVQAVSFLPNNLKDKITNKNFINYPLSLPQYTALFFNSNQETSLKDANLREALAMGINKEQITTETLNGNGEIINSPILPGQLGFYPELKTTKYSVNDANSLLDKTWSRIEPEEFFEIKNSAAIKNRQSEIDAIKNTTSTLSNDQGDAETASSTIEKLKQTIAEEIRATMTTGQTFYRKNKEGKILSLVITTADTIEYSKVAEAIAKTWRGLGIETTVQTVSARQINREAIKERSYQILLYSEIVGADSDLYPFWHSSQTEYPGLNLAQYVNRSTDKILEDARSATSTVEREKLYKQFQDILIKDLPAIFLYTPYYNFIVNKDIKNIEIKNIFSPSDRYNDLGNWYIKTSWQWK
ncbi:MAG: peptide ABC transporter substrate-binding protein [Candidatus Magasanikbacteria bacterium]